MDGERALHATQEQALERMIAAVDEVSPTEALKAAWTFVRKGNAYIEEVAPWALAKDDAQRRRLEVVLYELVDALRIMSMMLSPIIPRAAQELWNRLGLEGSVEQHTFEEARWGSLEPGTRVGKGGALFPRIDEAMTSG
jgi:methionyl-tRNA synthetase